MFSDNSEGLSGNLCMRSERPGGGFGIVVQQVPESRLSLPQWSPAVSVHEPFEVRSSMVASNTMSRTMAPQEGSTPPPGQNLNKCLLSLCSTNSVPCVCYLCCCCCCCNRCIFPNCILVVCILSCRCWRKCTYICSSSSKNISVAPLLNPLPEAGIVSYIHRPQG